MPLQKSFSERTRFSKRPQWHRSNTSPAAQQQSAARSLLRVSEATKNKLRDFQFQPQDQHVDSDGSRKSAPPVGEACDETTPPSRRLQDAGKENMPLPVKKEQQQPLPSAMKNIAMTPVGRLAWQDLMGTSGTKEQADDVSPSERIMWQADKLDHLSTLISPMLPRKKRARSSSPSSSPSNSKPMTPAVNVKKLTEALKTPHADPALDLWDRFSIGKSTNASQLEAATNPLLAHLMISSSPRPVKDGTPSRDNRSLRRAVSCAEPVPKRRRVDQPIGRTSGKPCEGLPTEESKISMVSHLLETVTGELERSDPRLEPQNAPQSPSPRRRGTHYVGRGRPAQREEAAAAVAATTGKLAGEAAAMKKPCPTDCDGSRETTSVEGDKSDYGDDEFDDDAFMELDASFIAGQNSQPGLGDGSQALENVQKTTAACVAPTEDEFGDFDDDIYTAAEDIVAQIDSKHTSQTISQGKPSKQASRRNGARRVPEEDTFGDDFGDDFDIEAVVLAATQSERRAATQAERRATTLSLSHPDDKPKAIQRYLVTNVFDCPFVDDRGREAPEKILVVQAERTNTVKTVHLRGDWLDTPVSVKAYIHVIGDFESEGHCVIDNSQNILILHPDQLISSTVIADSFSCMRRAVLQDRVKATSETAPALIYGTMLHEIFQAALAANKWDAPFLAGVIDQIISKHVEDLYVIKASLSDAREHLLSKMTELRHWAGAFVSAQPKADAVVQGRHGERIKMCVNKLLDVEEHVWSPMYGLKGNIDATVQVTMEEVDGPRTLTVPFEVKTGKNVSSNHQAQTVLYNLLLSDRYDVEIAYGILYYMETSQTIRIPAIRHELRHMIMQRNQLACYIRERSATLPPMKRNKNACGKCFAQTACFTYHKLADDGDGDTSGMGKKFDSVVEHLTPAHKDFFLKWEDLLTKEEKESQKLRRELWTLLSTEREKLGRCFGNVIIDEGSAFEDKHTSKINRFQYTFIKDGAASGFSFLDSQLAVGEPIVVSDEQGHFALALGYVTAVKKQRITVAVDRRLHNARVRQPGFDEENNQVFAGIMEVLPDGVKAEASRNEAAGKQVRFRLDKDEFSKGMATVRNNLVQVMADGPFGSREIRRLVVDLEAPRFKHVATQYDVDDNSLNVDQKTAIEKVMGAEDYALVLGMPGTGKTTTIAHIIRALIQQKKSVLLTSYTHTAVDNILLKLKDGNLPILRLGAPAKVHPEVQDFVTLAGQPMATFEQIRSAWHDSPIVATTCLGINHPIFTERTFDYCIVDEASQITLPICLGPIRMAKTFVLVGDHNQLPPLVQNEEARAGGLDVSLFKLLSDTHPDSVVNLEHQYRMCEDVMTLSNILIYSGRLKCGTDALRFRKLHVPHMDALRRHHYDAATLLSHGGASGPPRSFCLGPRPGTCWLRDLVEPEARVRFVNTDPLPDSREEVKGNRIVNPCEARVVVQLVEALLAAGVPGSEIGVMTHYRSQLAVLRHGLRGIGRGSGIEMHTADRFQGRDKEVVVLSLVRSNAACSIGDLLRDWRRINVAFTRAKTKLLVVGSRDTLRGCGAEEMLARFVGLMEERGWIYDLPADALEAHLFEDVTSTTTQASTTATAAAAVVSSQGSTSGIAKKKWSPGKTATMAGGGGKENRKVEPKKARIGDRALLKGKPILRDIFNDIVGGPQG